MLYAIELTKMLSAGIGTDHWTFKHWPCCFPNTNEAYIRLFEACLCKHCNTMYVLNF